MVTVEEARATVTEQQKAIEAERAGIEATRLPALSKAELLRRSMQQREQYRSKIISLKQAKAKALSEIKKYETEQLKPYEAQVVAAETQQASYEAQLSAYKIEKAEWEQARKLIIEGKEIAAKDDPSLRKKIAKLKAGMPEPTIVAPTDKISVEPLTAYKHIITGEMLYQTIAPEYVPPGYYPIAVSPTTLKELPAPEQLKLKLEKPELFVPIKVPKVPTYQPPETILGAEPFTLWRVPQYTARIVEKSLPYQKAISYTKTKFPTVHKILTTRTPKIVEEITSGVFVFSLFSPVMGTAAFQKLKIKGKFEKLAELDVTTKREIGKTITSKIEKDLLQIKTPKEQWKYLSKITKKLTTEEQKAHFLILVEKLFKKEILKPIPIKLVPTITKEMPIMFYKAPTIKGIGIFGGVVSRFPEPKQLFLGEIKVKEKPKLKERPLQLFAPALAITPRLVTVLKERQLQVPKLKQPQILAPVPKAKLALKSVLLQKYALKLKKALKYTPKYKPPFYRPIPKPKVPIPIPTPKTVKITKDYKITKTEVGYDYYIRRTGKWIFMGTAETITEASRKAAGIVAVTLAAAFKVMKEKKIVKVPFGKMFRPARKEVGVVVQKRKFRLAAKPEVKEIQWFRKKKISKKKKKKLKWL